MAGLFQGVHDLVWAIFPDTKVAVPLIPLFGFLCFAGYVLWEIFYLRRR